MCGLEFRLVLPHGTKWVTESCLRFPSQSFLTSDASLLFSAHFPPLPYLTSLRSTLCAFLFPRFYFISTILLLILSVGFHLRGKYFSKSSLRTLEGETNHRQHTFDIVISAPSVNCAQTQSPIASCLGSVPITPDSIFRFWIRPGYG